VYARVGDSEVLFHGKSITWSDEEGSKILVPGGPNTMHNNQPPHSPAVGETLVQIINHAIVTLEVTEL